MQGCDAEDCGPGPEPRPYMCRLIYCACRDVLSITVDVPKSGPPFPPEDRSVLEPARSKHMRMPEREMENLRPALHPRTLTCKLNGLIKVAADDRVVQKFADMPLPGAAVIVREVRGPTLAPAKERPEKLKRRWHRSTGLDNL